MNTQYIKYINQLGDSPNSPSSLTMNKEYEIQGDFSWLDEKDCWMIKNDTGHTTFYFKKRFSEPYNK